MRTLFITALIYWGLLLNVNAQNFRFGLVDNDALSMKTYDKDPTAHAVVLNEYGESRFFAGEIGHASITHDYHVKIKIFDAAGFKYGKVEIPLYGSDVTGREETLDQIQGVTTYKDANGVVTTKELDPYYAVVIKKNKNQKVVRFELPDLKPGCVIEFAYHFTTPFFQNFHPWRFQAEIPKKISSYETYIPLYWRYNTVLRGDLKLTRNTSDVRRQCFILGSAKADCVYSLYEMRDIPAFPVEEYMSAPKNYMSGLYFELTQHTELYTGKPMKIAKDWEGVDDQYQQDESFGGQFKKLDFLNNKIGAVIADISDPLAKAKAVYRYIQQNMKWDSCYATSSSSIRKAFDKKAGDAGDINLLLAAALNVAGIPASTVLLSTREHGSINKQTPSPTAFDYVIAEAKIDDKKYLLDATDPLLPFGILPLRTLNGPARVLSVDEAAHWIDLSNNQSKNTTWLVNLKLEDDGKLKGTLTSRYTGYEGYERRNLIKSLGTTQKYVEDLNKKANGIQITDAQINNLDSVDLALTETFNIEVKGAVASGGQVSVNPYVIGHIAINPFKTEDRNFPVDLGMPSDRKIIVNINYPATYTLEKAPQSATLSLPDQGGRYSVTAQSDNGMLSLTSTLSLKKPVYTVDEYQQLRELYDKVIEQEKQALVFKKK